MHSSNAMGVDSSRTPHGTVDLNSEGFVQADVVKQFVRSGHTKKSDNEDEQPMNSPGWLSASLLIEVESRAKDSPFIIPAATQHSPRTNASSTTMGRSQCDS